MRNFRLVMLPEDPGGMAEVLAEGVQFSTGQVIITRQDKGESYTVSLPCLPSKVPGFPANACLVWSREAVGPHDQRLGNLNERDRNYLVNLVEEKVLAAPIPLQLRLRELVLKLKTAAVMSE